MSEIDIIPAPPTLPSDTPDVVRKIALALEQQGQKNLYVDCMGKNMPYATYLATMIWDLIVTGEALFADGTPLAILDHKEWMATLKFVANHVEGVAKPEVHGGLNIYKIYMGIDVDAV
jgi:hypothetical protein